MRKNIVKTVCAIASSIAIAIALPQVAIAQTKKYISPIQPTEIELVKYEIALSQIFNSPDFIKNRGKYDRKSNFSRRFDGRLICDFLSNGTHTAESYIKLRRSMNLATYRDDPQKFLDEMYYEIAVMAAGIDNLCTEHRAQFMDFSDKLKSGYAFD